MDKTTLGNIFITVDTLCEEELISALSTFAIQSFYNLEATHCILAKFTIYSFRPLKKSCSLLREIMYEFEKKSSIEDSIQYNPDKNVQFKIQIVSDTFFYSIHSSFSKDIIYLILKNVIYMLEYEPLNIEFVSVP